MKGLIYKDLLSLKQKVITMGVLAVFYVALGALGGGSDGATNYFPMLAMLISLMVSLNCAGYDEQCGWDTFGCALPVSRTQVVMARYGMNLLVMLVTTVMVVAAEFLYHAVYGNSIDIKEMLFPIAVSLIYVGITNPIIYKFGANKSRLILAAILLVFTVSMAGLVMLLLALPDEGEVSFSDTSISWSNEDFAEDAEDVEEIDVGAYLENHSTPIMIGGATVGAGVYALSMLLSISIYKKKEL